MKLKYHVPINIDWSNSRTARIAIWSLIVIILFGAYVGEASASWWNTSSSIRYDVTPTRNGTISINLTNSCGSNNATWIYGCGHFNYSFLDNVTVQTNLYVVDDNSSSVPIWFENISTSGTALIWSNTTNLNHKQLYVNVTNHTINNTNGGKKVWRWFDDMESGITAGNWSSAAGGLTETGGYLRWVTNTGFFQRASSAYSPDAAGSWYIRSEIGVENTIDGYAYIGQTGTEAAGGASPGIQWGNNAGSANFHTITDDGARTDTDSGLVADSYWLQPTRAIVEIRKQPGTVQSTLYNKSYGFVYNKTHTTNVPALTNPLGLYGGLNLPMLDYWFAVGDYNSSESGFGTWGNADVFGSAVIYASDTLRYSNNSITSTQSTVLNKKKQIAITENYTGSWKINFTLYSTNLGYGQIYINDVAIGTLQNINSLTPTVYSQTFTGINITSNDYIQVYISQSAGAPDATFIKDFQILFDYDYANSTPNLIYPANNSALTSIFPPLTSPLNFTWTNVDTSGFNIMLCEDISCNIIVANETSTTNSKEISIAANTYWWKVRTYNPGSNAGNWSEIFTFTLTESLPAVSGTVINGVVYEIIGGVQVPVSGANVYLYNTSSTMGTTTGSNGYYQFNSVASTTYSIYVKKQGYETTDTAFITPTAGTATTYNILMRIYISPYVPNFIFEKIAVRTLYDAAYPGITVDIYKDGDLTPSFTGVTDNNGVTVFQLIKDTRYRMELSGGSLTNTITIYFFAKEETQRITIASGFPTGGNQFADINSTLFVTTVNSTWSNLSLYYSDNSSTTSIVYLYGTNMSTNTSACVVKNSTTFPVTLNCSVPTNGTYIFGFNATSSKYGFFQQDMVVNFGSANTSAPQVIGSKMTSSMLNWVSIIFLLFLAGMFSSKSVKYGVVVVPLLAVILYWFGTLQVSALIVHSALVLGILAHLRMSERQASI